MGCLHHHRIHALGEVWEEHTVGPFEDAVLGRNQAAGRLQRDGNDRQCRIENTRGIVRKQFCQRIRLIERRTDLGFWRGLAVVEEGRRDHEQDDGRDVEDGELERHPVPPFLACRRPASAQLRSGDRGEARYPERHDECPAT